MLPIRHWLSSGILFLFVLVLPACALAQSGSIAITENNEAYLHQTFIPDRVIHHSFSEDTFILPGYLPSSFSEDTAHDLMGIGFMYPEERNLHPLERTQSREIAVQGNTFSIDLLVTGVAGRVFLITALLDYQQIPFRLDGKEGLIHQISLPDDKKPDQDLVLPLEVDIPTEGIHDFIVIAFDTVILSQPGAETFMQRPAVIGRRTRLRVGNTTSTPPLPIPLRSRPILSQDAFPIDGIWLSRAECGLEEGQPHPHSMGCQLYWDEQPKERRYAFTIWVGDNDGANASDESSVQRAIFLFHNYHLVPFDENRFFTLVDIRQKYELVLPMSIDLYEGLNVIQAFQIFEPYELISDTSPGVYETFPAGIVWK